MASRELEIFKTKCFFFNLDLSLSLLFLALCTFKSQSCSYVPSFHSGFNRRSSSRRRLSTTIVSYKLFSVVNCLLLLFSFIKISMLEMSENKKQFFLFLYNGLHSFASIYFSFCVRVLSVYLVDLCILLRHIYFAFKTSCRTIFCIQNFVFLTSFESVHLYIFSFMTIRN